jgi:ankyrin repeat protein
MALHKAARHGQLEELQQLLLAAGADVNEANASGHTPLV